jgi:hypothetical protein
MASVEAILSLNDKQDLVLMIQLLNSIVQLPNPSEKDTPTSSTSHWILQLLGRLYRLLLEAYMDINLLLH